ncbi:hypothetical protein Pla144_48260 [Bythopirellula polymerisocia]|uniref:Uncharacterized protein n=1 Tax=Bythopirellula polymerisocia TaxID=2528003 RepID=A0A5C6C9I8_9BACT|nr:hypothetical protein Pla144_48260 [Bythopirellula polymerisocia]
MLRTVPPSNRCVHPKEDKSLICKDAMANEDPHRPQALPFAGEVVDTCNMDAWC